MICFLLHKKGLVKPNSSDRSKPGSLKQQRFQISSRFPCTCPCEARGFVCRSLQGLKFSPVHVAVRSAEVTGSQDTGLQSPITNKTSKHFYSLGRAQRDAGITNVRPLGSVKGLPLRQPIVLTDLATSWSVTARLLRAGSWLPPDTWMKSRPSKIQSHFGMPVFVRNGFNFS